MWWTVWYLIRMGMAGFFQLLKHHSQGVNCCQHPIFIYHTDSRLIEAGALVIEVSNPGAHKGGVDMYECFCSISFNFVLESSSIS